MEKILTVTEVAEILSVKPITVREMFREKRLRAFKVGKAWRTTETMLREDIEAMARGAAAGVPHPATNPTADDAPKKKPGRPASKPSPKADLKKPTDEVKKASAREHPGSDADYPRDADDKKPKKKEKKPADQAQFEFESLE